MSQIYEVNGQQLYNHFFVSQLTPKVSLLQIDGAWVILFEHGLPVAVVKESEFSIVTSGTTELARRESLSRGAIIFTTDWDNLQILANWLIQWHALRIADNANIDNRVPSLSFTQTCNQTRDRLMRQIDQLVAKVVSW